MFGLREYANKMKAFAASRASTAAGWQLEIHETEGEVEAIQIHYIAMTLTAKQVRTLREMPFLSLVNLTEPDSNYRYVVATNLVLTDSGNNETRLKVARKEWKQDELVIPYLAE